MSKGISETAFLSQVADLLNLFRWRWCHIRGAWSNKGYRTPIQGSDPDGFKGKGLPDIIAVRPPRLIFAELKDQYSKASPEQEAWLGNLRECVKMITLEPIVISRQGRARRVSNIVPSLEVYLWRPSQFDDIAECLR